MGKLVNLARNIESKVDNKAVRKAAIVGGVVATFVSGIAVGYDAGTNNGIMKCPGILLDACDRTDQYLIFAPGRVLATVNHTAEGKEWYDKLSEVVDAVPIANGPIVSFVRK